MKGETRLALLERNHAILGAVIGAMQPLRPDAVLLVVANPVDVLTGFALEQSGLPAGQVIGSGTMLDSVRLRGMLAEELHVGLFPVPRSTGRC
jgi:L-lactate dehydrogenase